MYVVEFLVDAAGIPAGTTKTLKNRAIVEELVAKGVLKLLSTEAPFTEKKAPKKDNGKGKGKGKNAEAEKTETEVTDAAEVAEEVVEVAEETAEAGEENQES